MNYWLLARPSFSFLSDYKISLQLPESDVSPPRRSLGFLLSLASALKQTAHGQKLIHKSATAVIQNNDQCYIFPHSI